MRQLGQLEGEVMDVLWRSPDGAAVRDVREGLERALAYTTVMTVLDNLHGKQLVVREKRGRAFVYFAARSREEHTADLMGEVLGRSDDRGAALLHFVGRMAPEDVAKLREALEPHDPGRER